MSCGSRTFEASNYHALIMLVIVLFTFSLLRSVRSLEPSIVPGVEGQVILLLAPFPSSPDLG